MGLFYEPLFTLLGVATFISGVGFILEDWLITEVLLKLFSASSLLISLAQEG